MFSDPASNLSKLQIANSMKVVDIGAGSGFYTIVAAKMVGVSGRVYAVDVQKDLLDRLRSMGQSQGLNNIEIVWGDAEKIGGTKLREGLADRVIVSNILFQVENADDLALEVKRITKIGGKVLIVDWSENSSLGPKVIFPESKALMLFEKHGFVLDSTFNAGDHHYGLIFKLA